MISSFLGKTKPINYVVLLSFMALFYAALQFFLGRGFLDSEKIGITVLTLLALLLGIFVINELVRQNKVTELSSFAMFFFVILTIIFPESLFDTNAVFANFFILLSIKKLLEVKETKKGKHKIFEAVLSICVATLFYKWAFVYFGTVVFAINTYESKNLKIWLVFLSGIITFFLLLWMFSILFGNQDFLVQHYNFLPIELDLDTFFERLNVKLIIYFVLIIICALVDFIKLRKKGGGRLIAMRSMLLFFMVVLILILLESKDAAPIFLSFFPASVFLTNFIDTIQRKRLKESVANLFIVSALLIFIIEHIG